MLLVLMETKVLITAKNVLESRQLAPSTSRCLAAFARKVERGKTLGWFCVDAMQSCCERRLIGRDYLKG